MGKSERASEPKDLVIEVTNITYKQICRALDDCLTLRSPKGSTFTGELGTLLFGPQYTGKVYVKGLYVQRSESYGMIAGVDLRDDASLRLGRDRNHVSLGDVAIPYMKLWSEAADESTNIANILMHRLCKTNDANNFELSQAEFLTEKGARAVSREWLKRHGQRNSLDPIPLPNNISNLREKLYLVEAQLGIVP